MKITKPIRISLIIAIAVGSGLGAYNVAHAVVTHTPAPTVAAPTVQVSTAPTPSVVPVAAEAVAPTEPQNMTEAPAPSESAGALTDPVASPAPTPAPEPATPELPAVYNVMAGPPVPIEKTSTPRS